MKLYVLDRIKILQSLPSEANFIDCCLVQQIRTKIAFTVDEREDFSIATNQDGAVTWNPIEDKGVEFKFEPSEVAMVATSLKSLDEKRKLTTDHTRIYPLFVLGESK